MQDHPYAAVHFKLVNATLLSRMYHNPIIFTDIEAL